MNKIFEGLTDEVWVITFICDPPWENQLLSILFPNAVAAHKCSLVDDALCG